MKKTIAMLLAILVVCFALTACQRAQETEEPTAEVEQQDVLVNVEPEPTEKAEPAVAEQEPTEEEPAVVEPEPTEAEPTVVEPEPTKAEPAATEPEPTVTEPEPTAERANDAAGSAFDGFDREGYIFYYTYIDGTIIDYIGQDEFEAWKDTLSERVTIYNVVQHFNVPKELLLEESEVGMRLSGDTPNAYKGYITPEQVEILCSGDEAAVNEAFMDPDIALLADGKVYSVFWLATHTAEEYEAAGITPEAVETLVARAEAYGGTRLASVCDFAAINNTLAAYKELVAE
jgi:hypothetical protein